jgi:hypothetical protein
VLEREFLAWLENRKEESIFFPQVKIRKRRMKLSVVILDAMPFMKLFLENQAGHR